MCGCWAKLCGKNWGILCIAYRLSLLQTVVALSNSSSRFVYVDYLKTYPLYNCDSII